MKIRYSGALLEFSIDGFFKFLIIMDFSESKGAFPFQISGELFSKLKGSQKPMAPTLMKLWYCTHANKACF